MVVESKYWDGVGVICMHPENVSLYNIIYYQT